MHESRALLTSLVYPEAVEREIPAAERASRDMREIELSADYLDDMRRIAEHRLGLAAIRLAQLFNRDF